MSPPINPSLQNLLQRPDIWRLQDGGRAGGRGASGLQTGFAPLDAVLHGGGWPRAALTELLVGQAGIGELQLLLPALAQVARQQLWQVWINPPFVPYAPALRGAGIAPETLLIVHTEPKQQLWACEQALRCAASGAVVYWPALPLRYAELRKLQVAAASQQSLAFIFRSTGNAAHTSPAALRLQLTIADADQLSVQVLKQRGDPAGHCVLLARATQLSAQTPLHQRDISIHRSPRIADNESTRADSANSRRTFIEPVFIEPSAGRRLLQITSLARGDRHAARR